MMSVDLHHPTITSDSAEILALRVIVRALVDEVAGGLGREPCEYRKALRRLCVDRIEASPMTMEGDVDAEDFRTQWMAVVASMLES